MKSYFRELLKEYKDKRRMDNLNKGRVIVLEQEWLKENAKECEKCQRKEGLTLDHIIPAKIIKEMGIDAEKNFMPENYRVLCKICNHFKGDRLDFSDKRTKELLIKYLELV